MIIEETSRFDKVLWIRGSGLAEVVISGVRHPADAGPFFREASRMDLRLGQVVRYGVDELGVLSWIAPEEEA